MIRVLSTALLVTALAASASQPGPAQPELQPEPQKSTGPHVYTISPSPASRSYLGVDIRDIDKDSMAALKLKEERGAEVTMVDQDAPAGKAGIKEHDVILEFNGTLVNSEEQLRRLIRETPPGRTVTLGISRDGNPIKLSVQLAEHSKVVTEVYPRVPAVPRMPELPELPNRMDIPVFTIYSNALGMQTENLTRQLGEFFGVKNGEGVLVRNVEKGSAAEKAGIKAGDVIVRVGNERLSDRSDLARILRKHRDGGKLSVGVMRDKKEQTLIVDVPQRGSRDSSSNDLGPGELESELASVQALAPEIASAAENRALKEAELARNRAMRELVDSLRSDSGRLRNYNSVIKNLQDELRTMEEQFKRSSHDML